MPDTAGEVRANSWPTFSYRPLHTDVRMLDDQLELIYNSSAWTQDVVYKTGRKRWMIETNGKRGSGKSVLTAWHKDDDCFYNSRPEKKERQEL